ncbi:MAG TPA: hypothetical protein VN721_17160 [Flavipsychrobacter sp.]|nr:hypothetical protein [Flavipsychrobacter sp.]
MKHQILIILLPLVFFTLFFTGCNPPTYKPMDIVANNQLTTQSELDYNLFPINPNWQYKLVNGKPPWTKDQCPLSDNLDDWRSSPTCTSQYLHFNNGQIFCTDLFSGHGGHMNWFPVTEVGIVNFEDHSSPWTDDDYNFYIQTPDSSLYMGSDDPDPMNQFLALEFDSDEFPDPVDDDYNIWWNSFHNAVNVGDEVAAGDLPPTDVPFAAAKAMVNDKLTIVMGMAGIDIGHDHSNTWTAELHPVFGMFILTNEQFSTNQDGTLAINDTWSFFIRNKGDEGWCGTSTENAGYRRLSVLIPELPYYYAGRLSTYPADARDNVSIDDGNVHITNWNGITDDNDPRRERWTKQIINGGVVFAFNFDNDYSDGIFVGDITLKWTAHINFKGFGDLRKVDKFMDEAKFKDKFKWMYNNNSSANKEYETKDDSLMSLRIGKLNDKEKKELYQALTGKIILPNMPKLESIPKGRSTKMGAVFAGKDSINIQQFNAQLRKMKIQNMPRQHGKVLSTANTTQNRYTQRKLSKRAFINAYLKSKNL